MFHFQKRGVFSIFFHVVGSCVPKVFFARGSLCAWHAILGISSIYSYILGDEVHHFVSCQMLIWIFGSKSNFPARSCLSLAASGCVQTVCGVCGTCLMFLFHCLSLIFHFLMLLCHSVKFWVSYEHNSDFGSGCFLRVMRTTYCFSV